MATPFSHTIQSLKFDSSRSIILIWLLVAFIFSTWIIWFLFVTISIYEVSGSARLQVETATHSISNSIAGVIVTNNMRLGSKIRKGEVLVQLSNDKERLRLKEELTHLQTIPPQIQALEKQIYNYRLAANKTQKADEIEIAKAKSNLKEAKTAAEFLDESWKRLESIKMSGQISPIEIKQARRLAESEQASAKTKAAELKHISVNMTANRHERQANLHSLQQKLAALLGEQEKSRATIERINQQMKNSIIRATVNGEIGEVNSHQIGTYIQPGTVLGRIIPSGKLKVVADFEPSRVLGRVVPGQQGRMRLHGYPWAQYGSIDVKVARIASEIRDGRIRVEFHPISQHNKLPMQHGLLGAVEVEVEKITPAVLVLRTSGQMLTRGAQPKYGQNSPIDLVNTRNNSQRIVNSTP